MFKRNSKRGQMNAGLITGLVFGIASLIIGVIIAFVIVSTLIGANLLQDGRTSVSVSDEAGYINSTGYTLAGSSATKFLSGSISISSAFGNATDGSVNDTIIAAGNYTVSAAGIITSLTAETWHEALLNYTYTLKTNEEVSTDALNTNFTTGVDNISSKIPTVLLIAAIVLILGVLVLLVGAWQRMRIGGGSI